MHENQMRNAKIRIDPWQQLKQIKLLTILIDFMILTRYAKTQRSIALELLWIRYWCRMVKCNVLFFPSKLNFFSTHCKMHVCTPWNRINRPSLIFKWKTKRKKNQLKREWICYVVRFSWNHTYFSFVFGTMTRVRVKWEKSMPFCLHNVVFSIEFLNNFPILSKYVSIHSIQ